MASVLSAQVWHYWLGVSLFGGAVLAAVATLGGFLKMQSTKYPRRSE